MTPLPATIRRSTFGELHTLGEDADLDELPDRRRRLVADEQPDETSERLRARLEADQHLLRWAPLAGWRARPGRVRPR